MTHITEITGQTNNNDVMRLIAQGYAPKQESTTEANEFPLTLMNRGPARPLLFIHPSYVNEYLAAENGPQPMSLLERLEFEQARSFSSMSFSHQTNGCGDKPAFPMGDPFELAFLKNATIEIRGVVRSKMSDDVRTKAQLIVAGMLKHNVTKPVKFVIHSPGGCATSMTSILDTMDMLKNTQINGQSIVVATYLDGMAASAASLILANGTPGHRFMNPTSKVMIHQPLGGAFGQVTDMTIENEQMQELKAYLVEFFKRTTKADDDWLKKVVERDYWMKLDECLRRGFVDKEYNAFNLDDLADLDVSLVFRTSKPEEPGSCGCS